MYCSCTILPQRSSASRTVTPKQPPPYVSPPSSFCKIAVSCRMDIYLVPPSLLHGDDAFCLDTGIDEPLLSLFRRLEAVLAKLLDADGWIHS